MAFAAFLHLQYISRRQYRRCRRRHTARAHHFLLSRRACNTRLLSFFWSDAATLFVRFVIHYIAECITIGGYERGKSGPCARQGSAAVMQLWQVCVRRRDESMNSVWRCFNIRKREWKLCTVRQRAPPSVAAAFVIWRTQKWMCVRVNWICCEFKNAALFFCWAAV